MQDRNVSWLVKFCRHKGWLNTMSQPPQRPGPSPYGAPASRTSAGRSSAPSPFRPASPYSPTPTPFQAQQQHRGPGYYHPMSPVPIGVPISPISPGMSPVLGGAPPGFIQCPRPRWPTPISPGNATARPFIPTAQVSWAEQSWHLSTTPYTFCQNYLFRSVL